MWPWGGQRMEVHKHADKQAPICTKHRSFQALWAIHAVHLPPHVWTCDSYKRVTVGENEALAVHLSVAHSKCSGGWVSDSQCNGTSQAYVVLWAQLRVHICRKCTCCMWRISYDQMDHRPLQSQRRCLEIPRSFHALPVEAV